MNGWRFESSIANMRRAFLGSILALSCGCGGSDEPGSPATDAGVETSLLADSQPADAAADSAIGATDVLVDAGSDAKAFVPECTEFPSKPAVGTWRPLSKSGFPSNFGHAFWTGTEILAVSWNATTRGLKAYDPAKDSWRTLSIDDTAPSARIFPLLGVVDGKLWLYGGRTSPGSKPESSGGIYDPATGTWTRIPDGGPLLDGGGDGAAPHIFGGGGKVLMLSALKGTSGEKPGAILDVASGAWSTLEWSADWSCVRASIVGTEGTCLGGGRVHRIRTAPPGVEDLPATPFSPQSVTWVGSHVFAWGGDDKIHTGVSWDGQLFDPASATWTKTAPGTIARSFPLVASVGGKVVIWGGTGNDPSKLTGTWFRNDGAEYDPATDAWARMSCTGAPTSSFLIGVVVGSELFVLGPSSSFFSSFSL